MKREKINRNEMELILGTSNKENICKKNKINKSCEGADFVKGIAAIQCVILLLDYVLKFMSLMCILLMNYVLKIRVTMCDFVGILLMDFVLKFMS